ncbi:3-dehydroquinate synthase [Emticicia oligotrophica DSM 17448]|uniref:3-dehydroquinate synthase n=1 Tax=Emticicia oligotrophica (strain DSM 17448 / CIP 109782 / MTCC 6937 / GPTSA100-15) TaxID=929562 RepID=A0ABM5MXK3_EMTOG|nr:3-dehydroquinate synthase [Emticicia oligotrophica]AFK01679.1 3-dehydroquinate synthase [Emticicia oligotrophica DSM 17448]
MNVIQQSFQVPFTFNIVFTKDLFSTENHEFSKFLSNFGDNSFQKKILFLIDAGVAEAHPKLQNAIKTYFQGVSNINLVEEILVLPGGEQVKNNTKYLDETLLAINKYGIDRHSFVAAIGGGAFLDMVGYASTIAHRGVKHIRIPTTVLSQNDSGVGVKNGVNFLGKKNFLGTFSPPVAVFNDTNFLTSLSDRDWRSGISEAVKVALIKDLPFFEWLEANALAMANREMNIMHEQIFRSAALHTNHISSGDPFEMGSARPLDFGHWAAHKLEYLTNFEIRHGEAVAIGIALDSIYSKLLGLISQEDVARIITLLKNLGFTLYHEKLGENDKLNLWEGLNEFREHLGGRLTITILEKLGKGREIHEVNFELMKQAVDELKMTLD